MDFTQPLGIRARFVPRWQRRRNPRRRNLLADAGKRGHAHWKSRTLLPAFYVESVVNKHDITSAVAEGSADISGRLNAKLIVVGTESGRAARDMRRYFPKANILAITNNEKTANQLVLSRGVIPYVDGTPRTLEEFFILAESVAKKLNLVENDDIIIATCGESVFIQGTTNSIKVIQVKA